jgi:hypothetical protein
LTSRSSLAVDSANLSGIWAPEKDALVASDRSFQNLAVITITQCPNDRARLEAAIPWVLQTCYAEEYRSGMRKPLWGSEIEGNSAAIAKVSRNAWKNGSP